MIDQIITFETAKLAKEKGFEQYSKSVYYCHDPFIGQRFNAGDRRFNNQTLHEEYMAYAVTQSLLAKWIRDVHKINITVHPTLIGDAWYFEAHRVHQGLGYGLDDILTGLYEGESRHSDTYEEALERALFLTLKLKVNEET